MSPGRNLNPANGVCSNPNKPDTSWCTDGNACTQSDGCLSGACVGTNPSLLRLDQSHAVGSCDPMTELLEPRASLLR